MTLAIIYGFLLVALAYSLAKDRRRTVMATKVGRKVLVRMLPSLVAVVGLVGLIISLVPPPPPWYPRTRSYDRGTSRSPPVAPGL